MKRFLFLFLLLLVSCDDYNRDALVVKCVRGHYEIDTVALAKDVVKHKFVCLEELPLAQWKGKLYHLGAEYKEE